MRKITEVGTYVRHTVKDGLFRVTHIYKDSRINFYFILEEVGDNDVGFSSGDEYIKEVLSKETHPEYYL